MEVEMWKYLIQQGPVIVFMGVVLWALWQMLKSNESKMDEKEQAFQKVLNDKDAAFKKTLGELNAKDSERDKEFQTYWEEKEEKYLHALETKDNLLITMQERAISTYEKMANALDRLTEKLKQ